MGRPPIDPVKRFWSKVEKTDGCWKWSGCKDPNGYGRHAVEHSKQMLAHRYSYVLHVGPIPPGVCVLHRCDNPECTNPVHLFLGTQSDNQADKVAKGRQAAGKRNGAYQHKRGPAISRGLKRWHAEHPERVVRGNKHHNARLTDATVREIRELYEDGFPQSQIGARYGVSQATIARVLSGETWAHVK